MKEMIKSPKFYIRCAATLLGLLGLILYFVTMILQDNSYVWIPICMSVATVISLASLFLGKFRSLDLAAGVLFLLGGFLFIVTQFDNIGYAVTNTGIGDGIMPTFVMGAIFLILAGITDSVVVYLEK